MFKTSKGIKSSLMASISTALASVFGPTPHNQIKHHNPSKNSRGYYNRSNFASKPAGSKIRRAIARGNHGLVNKHGTIGAAVAEGKRERWLLEHNKPVIRLSTSI